MNIHPIDGLIKNSQTRSISKAITWRIIAAIITGTTVFIYTGKLKETGEKKSYLINISSETKEMIHFRIKTAGYAGGIAGAANFGTITFSAKKEGSGIIKTGDSSMALNADSQNNLSGFSQISFLISKPATPAPSLSPSQKPKLKTPEISPIAGTATLTPSASSSESIDSEINSEKPDFASIQTNPITEEKNFAGIGNIITLGTGNNVLGIIIIMAAIGVIALIVSAIIKRRKKNIQPPAGNSQ